MSKTVEIVLNQTVCRILEMNYPRLSHFYEKIS